MALEEVVNNAIAISREYHRVFRFIHEEDTKDWRDIDEFITDILQANDDKSIEDPQIIIQTYISKLRYFQDKALKDAVTMIKSSKAEAEYDLFLQVVQLIENNPNGIYM